jgi:hypothetical protein
MANTKISLVRSTLPIKDELKSVFPTLLSGGAEGMPNLEVVVDSENGQILRSDKPLRVSFRRDFISARYRKSARGN